MSGILIGSGLEDEERRERWMLTILPRRLRRRRCSIELGNRIRHVYSSNKGGRAVCTPFLGMVLAGLVEDYEGLL